MPAHTDCRESLVRVQLYVVFGGRTDASHVGHLTRAIDRAPKHGRPVRRMHVSTKTKTLVGLSYMHPFGQNREWARRQLGVLMVVLSAHVLVVMILLLSSGRPDRPGDLLPSEPPTAVVRLDLESPAEQPRLEQTSKKPLTGGIHAVHTDRAQKTSSAAESRNSSEAGETTAISPGEAPSVDWYRELDTAVEAVTPEMIRKYTRLCAEAERPHMKHPPGCPRSRYEGPWRPSGGGNVFTLQDIRDPDRPRGGVPDALPPAFPKPPQSIVRIRPDP
jgi:hypothetical protein